MTVHVLMLPRPGRVRGDALLREPQPQGQLSKHSSVGGDGYHTCTPVDRFYKLAHTVLAVAVCIFSVTLVKINANVLTRI